MKPDQQRRYKEKRKSGLSLLRREVSFRVPMLALIAGLLALGILVGCTASVFFLVMGHLTIQQQSQIPPTTFPVATSSSLFIPTPTARFSAGNGYQQMTTKQVGPIPANTRVEITGMRLDADGWIYTIMMPNEKTFAAATDSQLAYISGATPGAMPAMKYASEIGMGGYRMITLQQVGSIPQNTRVRISSARIGVDGWLYNIVGIGEKNFADAQESQIAYAPGTIPGATTTP